MYQPDIKNNFFHSEKEYDLITGIVYNKIYSRSLIQNMANTIGEATWNLNLSYMEDFIIVLAAVREAKSYIKLSFGGIWHWYENPEGMTNGVFDLYGDKLKYGDSANKKLESYFIIWDKSFDMTENDSNASKFRMNIIQQLAEKPDRRNVFARSKHFDMVLNLILRFINWKYINKYYTKLAKKFGRETIEFSKNIEDKNKYKQIYKVFYS